MGGSGRLIPDVCLPVRAVHVPCTARIDKSRSDLPLCQAFVWLSLTSCYFGAVACVALEQQREGSRISDRESSRMSVYRCVHEFKYTLLLIRDHFADGSGVIL